MRAVVVSAVAGLALVAGAAAVLIANAAPPKSSPPSAERSMALIEAAKANQNLKAQPAPTGGWPADTAYGVTLDGLMGGQVPMSAFKGKVVMVVNTASKCGLTPQYEGLESLYKAHGKDGLVVLGVPSGDFMGQELAEAEDIAEFCQVNFGVTFPMAAKSHVKGKEANPLHKWAVAQLGDAATPKWNFHKILIGRDGKAITAFDSATDPQAPKVVEAVKAALKS